MSWHLWIWLCDSECWWVPRQSTPPGAWFASTAGCWDGAGYEAESWWLARLTLVIHQTSWRNPGSRSIGRNKIKTFHQFGEFKYLTFGKWLDIYLKTSSSKKSFDLWRSQFCVQVTCTRYLGLVCYGAVCKSRSDLWFYSLNLHCKINILSKNYECLKRSP